MEHPRWPEEYRSDLARRLHSPGILAYGVSLDTLLAGGVDWRDMGRSIGGGKEGPRIYLRSTPAERVDKIRQLGIVPRQTKVRFTKDPGGRRWRDWNLPLKEYSHYDVLRVDNEGMLILGYRNTNYRVGKISPNHPHLEIINP